MGNKDTSGLNLMKRQYLKGGKGAAKQRRLGRNRHRTMKEIRKI